MATAENAELVDTFGQFFRAYYDDRIKSLARSYPNEQRSLFVDWNDLYRFDHDLADDYLSQPDQYRSHAEEALRLYDLPIDVSLGRAHVRLVNLPESETPEIREIRADSMNRLVEVRGIVRKATDVRPKIVEAAFECQLCGTLTRVAQSRGEFQEPHECHGCERQGPFRVNFDQSEFVDAQKLRIQESPEGLRGGETPQALDVTVEDDVTGTVAPGDHVSAVGILRLEQQGGQQDKSPMFDFYMDGVSLEVDDEQFEEMEITTADEARIQELAGGEDVYERIVESIAPSIYGYEEEKLAMALQLFSGVTKNLPDGSRVRGDMHILLVGDPGTGKSQLLSYIQTIAPRAVYTSGKGSSTAGLCVTGDTMVATPTGRERIKDLVSPAVPEPVATETAAPAELAVLTYDPGTGGLEVARTSHAWRMPEKPCARIETADGRSLEASRATPVLVAGEDGPTWRDIAAIEPGDRVATPAVAGATAADRRRARTDGGTGWSVVTAAEATGPRELFDLTVPGTHTFLANGIVTHNTAAAVRDDFADGQQWSLEAGALVLADRGIAAVDELDKMAPDDRSALHEGLEQQQISISKAGINATLKSRCSLLGAANPEYGRFDSFEPLGEQIDLEPALISRFDLIFTVTDQPDPEEDRALAEHILQTNYAGELTTQHEQRHPAVSEAEIADATERVDPAIEPELFRKYIAHAKQSCHPRMTDDAREAIRDFYVDLRKRGEDDDAPVPVTARKLEGLVRLAEASARVRLSDTVSEADARRVIDIVRSSLQDISIDPETGEYDVDIVEAGTTKSQRDRIQTIKDVVASVESEYDEGAPVDVVLDRAEETGIERSMAEDEIESLKQRGELYMPAAETLRTL